MTDTFVWFGSTKLSNNSLITLRELNESNNLNLTCVTENTMCCSESQYIGWKFPNGSNIEQNHTGQSGVYTSVQNRSIILHVTSEVLAVLPTGIYTCNIIDLGNTSNPLYIGIFEESEGT